MDVWVRIVGLPALGQSLGPQEKKVSFPGTTLGDLLEHLIREHGPTLSEVLLDEMGKLDPAVQVIRNGEQWLGGKDLSAELQDGDSIVFLYLLAGG